MVSSPEIEVQCFLVPFKLSGPGGMLSMVGVDGRGIVSQFTEAFHGR